MSIIICPKCKEELILDGNSLKCKNNHCYDRAKEGYTNLLLTSRSGEKIGDSKESAAARHRFLAKGYYKCLKDRIAELLKGSVLDICCGDGYYDDYDGKLYGFDISKEMVRLASKSQKSHTYFVANLADIPVKSKSFDTCIHLFAPFNEKEFCRVMKDDGVLYSVIPGENHLYEMKEILYDSPYKNDEKAPESLLLNLTDRIKVSETVSIDGDDLYELFSMTPYYYHTSDENKARLKKAKQCDLTVEFVILKYTKKL